MFSSAPKDKKLMPSSDSNPSPFGLSPTGQLLPRRISHAHVDSMSSLDLLVTDSDDGRSPGLSPSPHTICNRKVANRASWALFTCLKLFLFMAGLFTLLELLTLLWVGDGIFFVRKGRYHEHNQYQHGLRHSDHVLAPDAIVIVSMGTTFLNTQVC